MNPMRDVLIEKVTVNIGMGKSGEALENARTLIKKLTGKTAVTTYAKVRNPTFKIRKGDPIGAKTTLRKKGAEEFLKKALVAIDANIPRRSFDREGNFAFGIKEYIDFPGAKYDPKIGILGFDVCVTLSRKGARIMERKRAKAKIGRKHRITREEGITFAKEKFGVQLT